MKTIHINSNDVSAVITLCALENKTAWLVVKEMIAVEACSSRTAARAVAATIDCASVVKASDVKCVFDTIVKPPKAKKEAKATKAATVEPTGATDDVLHASSIESPCKAVWEIADEMKLSNPTAKRAVILAECVSRGIAYYTARTQYQQWREVQKEMAEREALQAAGKLKKTVRAS